MVLSDCNGYTKRRVNCEYCNYRYILLNVQLFQFPQGVADDSALHFDYKHNISF